MILIKEKEGWYYLAVKKLSAFLYKETSKYGVHCLNCIHSFRTENKLESHKKTCKSKDFCETVMSSVKNERLKFNEYMKSDKISYITYADIESLITKIDGYANNQ